MDSNSELHEFVISHDPEIELTFSKELLEMSDLTPSIRSSL